MPINAVNLTGTIFPAGPKGETGPANNLEIGTVEKGIEASATITGDAPNQILNLVLPKGDKGEKGDTGSTNSLEIGTVERGTEASATITGESPNQVLNLVLPIGPKGEQGLQGEIGPANSLTIGTVEKGTEPSATITGDAPNQVLNLVLPTGETAEIEALKAKHAQEISALENLIPTGQASGESIDLNDSAEYKFKKFGISGNSKQETREGYNLLNAPKLLDITGIKYHKYLNEIPSGSIITVSWGNYILGGDNPPGFDFRDSDNNTLKSFTFDKPNSSITFTLNGIAASSSIYSNGYSFVNSQNITTTINDLMVNIGSKKPYEEYGAMPSPEFPSSIRNCGDNVNIFDMDTAILKQYNTNGVLQSTNRYIKEGNKTKITYSNYQYGRYFFDKQKLQKGTYTYSFDVYLSNDATNLEGVYSIRNFTNSTDIKPLTTITLSNNKKKFSIPFEIKEEAEVSISLQPNDNNSKILYIENLKLEQGLIATPYSPYNCSNVNITVCNENFLDTSDFEIVGSELDIKRNENGSFTVNGTSTGNTIIKFKKKIKMNGSYTLIEAGEKAPVSVYTTLYKNIDLSDAIAFIDSYSTARYANFEINTVSLSQKILFSPGTYSNYVIKPMLIEGTFNLSNIGDYIEHQSQTITFPLAEGQKLMLGDYLADDGIHHKRKQTILGDITFLTTATVFGVEGQFARYSLPNTKKVSKSYDFMSDRISPANETFGQYKGYKNDTGLYVITTADDTVKNFNSKISGSIVEYELAEEETVPYTEEQREAYNKIKELYSYKGTTHITCENEVSCIFQTGYYKDLETILNNMQAQILAE